MNKRKHITSWAELTETEIIFYDGFDEAIIGLTQKFNQHSVLYDYDKCIDILCRDMNLDDAIEHMSFNVLGGWLGESTPTFLMSPEEYDV